MSGSEHTELSRTLACIWSLRVVRVKLSNYTLQPAHWNPRCSSPDLCGAVWRQRDFFSHQLLAYFVEDNAGTSNLQTLKGADWWQLVAGTYKFASSEVCWTETKWYSDRPKFAVQRPDSSHPQLQTLSNRSEGCQPFAKLRRSFAVPAQRSKKSSIYLRRNCTLPLLSVSMKPSRCNK